MKLIELLFEGVPRAGERTRGHEGVARGQEGRGPAAPGVQSGTTGRACWFMCVCVCVHVCFNFLPQEISMRPLPARYATDLISCNYMQR